MRFLELSFRAVRSRACGENERGICSSVLSIARLGGPTVSSLTCESALRKKGHPQCDQQPEQPRICEIL